MPPAHRYTQHIGAGFWFTRPAPLSELVGRRLEPARFQRSLILLRLGPRGSSRGPQGSPSQAGGPNSLAYAVRMDTTRGRLSRAGSGGVAGSATPLPR